MTFNTIRFVVYGPPSVFSTPWLPIYAAALTPRPPHHQAHAMASVTSDYGATPPADITLSVGLTRRGNVLLGGTSATVAKGRNADLLFEHTVFGDAVCGGIPTAAGTYEVDSSVPNVLIR